MPTAYIALGSNLGDRQANLDAAVRRLRAEPGLRVAAVSAIYETAPVDCPPDSGDYLNAVLGVETDRSPEDLLKLLLHIERQFGRTRTGPNSPRTLDLDLLLCGDHVLATRDLILPHPRLHERAFVLVPLAEIAPEVIHPTLGKSVRGLRDAVPPSGVRPAAAAQPVGDRDLAGQTALVTGSTSGIGLAIARAFADRGATILLHGRRLAPPVDASDAESDRFGISTRDFLEPFQDRGVEVRGLGGDLTDPAACDRLADEAWAAFGGVEILVLNAGADTLTGEAARWSFEQKLDALLAVDLKATMRLARNLGDRMKARGRGCILTMGWDQAETGMEGDSGQLFAAAKGAVMCFTRSLALSLAPEVRVNCLAPGWVRTAWGETASPVWQDRVKRETPLGVWGLADDIASAAVWLASPRAGFVTGQTIRINGGAVRG